MKCLIAACICLMTGGATLADTVVAAKVIRAGQVISQEDLRLASGRAGGEFSAIEDILGLEAQVTIYPGRSIRRKDIGSPALVDRNQLIRIHYIAGPLQIFAEGRALGRVDKRDSHQALIMIQAGICDGGQFGTSPYVGRGMGVL